MINSLMRLVNSIKYILIINIISLNVLANERLVIGTTTSVYDSGLILNLEKIFESKYNVNVDVISQSTGQILNNAKMGNIDLLIVHHKKSEEKFIKEGFGIKRINLMFNEFIVVGPKNDPAKVINKKNLKDILMNIYNSKSIFLSRGDLSGTNLKEVEMWENNGFKTEEFNNWYKKVGKGMGPTLNMANALGAYTLTDKSTWLNMNNKNNLRIIYENKKKLFNQYSIIPINPSINKKNNNKIISIFLDWVLSEEGKNLINNYSIKGEKSFFFNGDDYINK